MPSSPLQTHDFEFSLPPELIAQTPLPERDQSKLLHLSRSKKSWEHLTFSHFPSLLQPGDVLIVNNSKVLPARLLGRKSDTGGEVEVLLLEEDSPKKWWVMLKPGRRVRPNTTLVFGPDPASPKLHATVLKKNDQGHCLLQFEFAGDFLPLLDEIGLPPLPPYIRRDSTTAHPQDRDRYQTVYAASPGSVACPTAGLHLTLPILQHLKHRGVAVHPVTLHVGAGTFAPVKSTSIADHSMHSERFILPPETAAAISAAKAQKRRVIAVGTTSCRVLESAARLQNAFDPASHSPNSLQPMEGATQLFLYPPTHFRVIDALLTNFHLPCSTLLMLVSAFASPGKIDGRDLILQAYHDAIAQRYRFFSYGDAMFIN